MRMPDKAASALERERLKARLDEANNYHLYVQLARIFPNLQQRSIDTHTVISYYPQRTSFQLRPRTYFQEHYLNAVAAWINVHPTLAALLGYYFASAFVGSLEGPDATSSKLYRFLFTFCNTLAANLKRAYATKLPSGELNTAENAAKQPAVVVVSTKTGEKN